MTSERERPAAPTGNFALVTGASRGVGRGIALGLLAAGFRVYGSGRSIEQADLPREIRRLRCDHLRDDETARVFETIRSECGSLDLLVNCAWGGYEKMAEGGVFTWPAPFWDQPPHRWTGMMDAGVRAAFMARTGQVLVAAAVAKEMGVLDIDGSSPPVLTLAELGLEG